MPMKSVLVLIDDHEGSDARLDCARAFAERHDAHLSALSVGLTPTYAYGMGAEANAEVFVRQAEQARERAQKVADAARTCKAPTEPLGDVRVIAKTAAVLGDAVGRQARYADVVLAGQPEPDKPGEYIHTCCIEGALFESGHPVIVIPPNKTWDPIGRRIMIAWDTSREAARAVADASSLLPSAEAVSVAIVDPEIGGNAHGEEPGADIGAHLARHGANVSVDRLPREGLRVSEALNRHATDFGADLIVMGAYGHSRLRETLFGGVTREMLTDAKVPVLLSH